MGKLIAAAPKGGGVKNTELPPYDPDTQQITLLEAQEGVGKAGDKVSAPDGTKYEILVDGKPKLYILHHARTVKGGWKAMRPPAKKDDTTTPAAGRRRS